MSLSAAPKMIREMFLVIAKQLNSSVFGGLLLVNFVASKRDRTSLVFVFVVVSAVVDHFVVND